MTQLLCEEFNVPSLIIANSAVLTTLASCRTTALVVDCGGGSTIVTPVVHCRSLAQAVISSPVAGEVLTDCLTRRLENNGQLLKIGRKATETITRGNLLVQSRKNCADSLKLHITEIDGIENAENIASHTGLTEMVINCINKCEGCHHAELYSNILLTGGPTSEPQLKERLQKDVQ
ncbi:actin-related protein 4-like isoform X2 [Malus sylvestris]|uniref:actin-related protein 4-like isoform X2 n=1 Tax=Malus sylvestris TaxID=3752 RepID=UPI0021AC89BE|nr:actin-related protein 4-like isoform X2 [Malus sylvestris]